MPYEQPNPLNFLSCKERSDLNLQETLEVKSKGKKRDTQKNCPLIKNPQFLSYPHETS